MTKILVIEDQALLREEILEILSIEEFQVIGAENGRIGLELVQTFQPDLILCDVSMPELDGHGVLEELRKEPETVTIPFIFLTAMADKADLRQGMTLGADDYLTKPFDRIDLLEAIATQFRKQQAIDSKIHQKVDDLRSNITLSLPHELHTPLTGIISSTELLLEDFNQIDPAESLEILETIHVSAHRLYRLTQNFLLYAELELIMADPSRVAMIRRGRSSRCYKEVIVDWARAKATEAKRLADLRLDVHQDITVSISELKLRKIVEELLDNAFKFSLNDSPVHLAIQLDHTTIDTNMVTLYVLDHGRGMSEEQIANIGAYMQFERRLYEQQGSGLGLVIAKRLTELHGGEFRITSIPNQQTLVKVMLPSDTN